MDNAHTVICLLEAKQEKVNELKEALIKIIKPSRAESTCIDYRLHQDLDNPHRFILYEIWESKEAHQKQFEKSYIQDLAQQLNDLLANPYQVYFAHELK